MLSFATLQVLNLLQTTFLLGFNLSLSFISIHTILLSPSPILAIRQWNFQFHTAKVTATTLSASELILSLILAYGSSINSGAFATTTILYAVSSFLSFLIFPFTLHFMQPLNEILEEKHKAQLQLHYADLPEKHAGMQTARDLQDHDRIAKWGWLNWFRVATYASIVLVNAAVVLNQL